MNFEDRGGLMGFEILPIEPGDEDRYDIITITSPETWTPFRFQGKTMALHTTYQKCTNSFDPSDTLLEMGELPAIDAPIKEEDVFHDCLPVDNPHFIMHQLTYDEITGKHKVNPHTLGYPSSNQHENLNQAKLLEDDDLSLIHI